MDTDDLKQAGKVAAPGACRESDTVGRMTVLVVEPMGEPYQKEIEHGLSALQTEVDGDITAVYPFRDPVALVLNDEGKLAGLPPNRALRDRHGEVYDVIAGTFLVVGIREDRFVSLTPELAEKYRELFWRPERFLRLGGKIAVLPME